MKIMTKFFAVTLTTLAFALVASADDAKPAAKTLPPASTKKDVTYATDIKPMLDASCAKCHGSAKPRAGLALDSLAGVLKGSKDGKVVIPGDSAKSQLVRSAGQVGPASSWMPPVKAQAKNPALTADQVGLIRAWIDQGAK